MPYNVRCQVDGWPEGVSESEKVELAKAARELIQEAGPQTTTTVERYLWHKLGSGRWPNRGCLWDHIYATVERACYAADLERVWSIRKV